MSATIDISPLTESCPELYKLYALIQAREVDFWLVGGTLRDLLLGLSPADIDLCCSIDPTAIARAWSRQVDGRWFWLDQARKQSRVLLASGISLDFAPLRAATLHEDLLLRDFTINALALPLQFNASEPQLIDPCDGLADLQAKRIMDCSPRSFPDDPLRMLKGVRHAVCLGYELADETRKRIREHSALLAKTAGERIREEFCRILAEDIAKGLELLQTTGLLGIISGIANISAETIEQLQDLDCRLRGFEEKSDLSTGEKGTIATRTLMLLAELLRLEGDSELKPLLHDRLRLSKHQQQLVIGLQQELPTATIEMVTQLDRSRRQALFYECLQPCAFEKLLRWGVCRETMTRVSLTRLQNSFADLERGGRVPDLLNGHQLGSDLLQGQHNKIGHWLQRIKEAELNGIIATEKNAQSWLEQQLAIDR
jgi:poly(A) polymerase